MIVDAPFDDADCPSVETPKRRPHRSNMFAEAKELQELMLQDAKKEGLKPIERSALGRVWKELGEFRLRLQGKGPPKAVDYAGRKAKRSSPASFTETPQAKTGPTPAKS